MGQMVLSGSGGAILSPVLFSALGALTPFVAAPFALVLTSLLAQRGFAASGEKLQPKLSRLSMVQNAKNKFGSKGLFEFVKSTVKLIVFSWCLFAYLKLRFENIVMLIVAPPEQAAQEMMRYAMEFLVIVLAVSIVIGGIDYLWQRFEHHKKHRMSHKELRDEAKEVEGDPQLKQSRRGKAEQIALNTMLANVPKADVVIVNPVHYAVALTWSRAPGSAPECVAKGVDEIALRLKALAKQSDVPVHEDPPTARALYASVEIGQEIPPDQYRAVAAAIRFSDAMRRKKRHR